MLPGVVKTCDQRYVHTINAKEFTVCKPINQATHGHQNKQTGQPKKNAGFLEYPFYILLFIYLLYSNLSLMN